MRTADSRETVAGILEHPGEVPDGEVPSAADVSQGTKRC
jgi:hypothetical protein